jgi:D-glycero-D-manno-heptose 1,7-bisphosphate phosphatase
MVTTKSEKAIFFDRDGILNKALVVNRKPRSPRNIKELIINTSIKDFLLAVKKNYYLICVTNQPEVGRKTFLKKDVDEINIFIKNYFNLDDVFSCYHEKDNICDCRKPKIGMLLEAKKKYFINLNQSIVIGDRWKDVTMGKKAGCKTIFVDYNYDETLRDQPDIKIDNLENLKNYVPI